MPSRRSSHGIRAIRVSWKIITSATGNPKNLPPVISVFFSGTSEVKNMYQTNSRFRPSEANSTRRATVAG